MRNNLHITNQTLIEECRKGNKEALNLFYLRFAPRMLSVIHRYIPDPEDAEDILHDGFIVGLTRLDSLRDADKVEIWLATIMKNLSLRFLQEQDMSQILHDIPEVDDTPEIEEILDLNTLETLIAKLPAGYQKVFRLAILENKSHKEIGALLGIAPNSSSSQLFHAKLMMRKLIKDYKSQTGLMILIIAAALIGLLLPHRLPILPSNEETVVAETIGDNITISHESIQASDAPATVAHTILKKSGKIFKEDILQLKEFSDTIQTPADTAEISPRNDKEREEYSYAEANGIDASRYHLFKRSKPSGWSLNVGAEPGLLRGNLSSDPERDLFAPGSEGNTKPEKPETDNDTEKSSRLQRKTEDFHDYRNMAHTNSLPISAALTVSKKLNGIFSIETGMRYTYLHSRFESSSGYADCHWHYIGIPLKINTLLHSYNRFKIYIGVGGTVNIPLYSNSVASSETGRANLQSGKFSSPVVWSLSGNLGASIKISRKIDLFLEPTLQYNFNQNYTVPNTWTDNKWTFSIPLGIRLNL